MSSTARTSTRPRPGRPLARLRHRDEQGYMLIEALVFMGVIAFAVLGYANSSIAVNDVQRTQTATDIVAQHSQGILERAQATPWADLGLVSSDPGYAATGQDGRPTVQLAAAPSGIPDDERLKPALEYDISGGVHVNQRVDVTWLAPGTATTAKNPADFGTKQVTITVTFTEPGSPRTRVQTYRFARSASASEALVETLPASTHVESVSTPSQHVTCPTLKAARSGTQKQLTFTAVAGASTYKLFKDGAYTGYTATASAPYFNLNFPDGDPGLAATWRLDPVPDDGSPTPTCPGYTTTASTWSPPASCPSSYKMYHNAGGYWNLWWAQVPGATHYLYTHPAGSGDFIEGSKTAVSGGVTYDVLQVFNDTIGGGNLTVTPANDMGTKTCPSIVIQPMP